MYIVCPYLLSIVGETSYGIAVGSIESDKVIILLLNFFTSEVKSLHLSS
jgi:hypothetical protein